MLSYFASFHLQKLKYIYNKSRSKSGAGFSKINLVERQHKVKKDIHNIIKLRAVIIHSGIYQNVIDLIFYLARTFNGDYCFLFP